MIGRQHVPSIAALLAVGICLTAAWLYLRALPHNSVDSVSALEFPGLNCRFYMPSAPWRPAERTITSALQARLVIERPKPRAWLALMVQDHGNGTPSTDGVRDEALRRLGNYFNKDNLEWEEAPGVQLAGRAARRFIFHGEVENTAMSGECSMLAEGGLAYWLVLWSPISQAQVSAKDYDDLRGRLVLLDQRSPARAQPAPTSTIHLRGVSASLEARNPIWQQWEPPTDYDALAILALVARERRSHSAEKGPPPAVAASAVFLVLHPGEENKAAALKRAVNYLENQQKALYPETRIEALADSARDSPHAGPLRLVSLRVRNGEHRERYVLLGLIPGKAHLVVVQCECAWGNRAEWQPQMEALLERLKIGRDEGPEPTNHGAGGDPGVP